MPGDERRKREPISPMPDSAPTPYRAAPSLDCSVRFDPFQDRIVPTVLGWWLQVSINPHGRRGFLHVPNTGARAVETAPGTTTIPNFSIRTKPAAEPVELLPGLHLFIDDYLVAESKDLTRSAHAPQRYEGNPILGWEQGTTQPYLTVVRDPETKLYRMPARCQTLHPARYSRLRN
jgi:hypothetical protein